MNQALAALENFYRSLGVGRPDVPREELPQVAELDLTPVIALADGCVAVDARVRVWRPESATGPKSW